MSGNDLMAAILHRIVIEQGQQSARLTRLEAAHFRKTRTKASAISTEARTSTKGQLSTVLADWKSRLALLELGKAALPWIPRLLALALAGWQWVLPLLQRLLSALW